jgi:hypothetical protein
VPDIQDIQTYLRSFACFIFRLQLPMRLWRRTTWPLLYFAFGVRNAGVTVSTMVVVAVVFEKRPVLAGG